MPTGAQLIGRRKDLELIGAQIDAARDGSGSVLLVTGEAGAGKSSLCRAAMDVAARSGVAVRFGRCLQLEIERPFAAVFEALDLHASDVLGTEPGNHTLLEAGSIAAVSFLAGERLLEEVEARATEMPVLMVLEDLHWSDAGTRQLLRLLIDRAGDLALGLLVSSRTPRPGTPVQRLLDACPNLQRLDVRPLDTDEVAELVTRAVGATPGRASGSRAGARRRQSAARAGGGRRARGERRARSRSRSC